MRIIITNTDDNFSLKNDIINEFVSKLNYSEVTCLEENQLLEYLEMIKSSERVLIVDYTKFPLILSNNTYDLLNKNSFYSSIKILISNSYDGNIIVGKVYDIIDDLQRVTHVKDNKLYMKQPIVSLNMKEDNTDIVGLYELMKDNRNESKKLDIMNYYLKKSTIKKDEKDMIHYIALMSEVDRETVEVVLSKMKDLSGLFLQLEKLESGDENPMISIIDNFNATIEDGKVVYFSTDFSKNLKEISEESIKSVIDFLIMADRSKLQKRMLQVGDSKNAR